MLVIRDDQMTVLIRALEAQFEREACEHVQRYFPARCLALGSEETANWVREGLEQATRYGFDSRYDQLRYLNLVFEFGQGFERSDAGAWALPFLEGRERTPRVRMDLLMEEACGRVYRAVDSPRPPAGPEGEPASAYDGIAWEDSGIDPNYVPVSILPEYEPINSSTDEMDDDDDDGEPEVEEEDEETDGRE